MSQRSIKEAVEYLKTSSSKTGKTVYNQITNVVTKILENRSQNPELLDSTYLIKDSIFQSNINFINNEWAQESFKAFDGINKNDSDDVYFPNFLETSYYFEQAGIGLGQEETFKIFLALRNLCILYPKIEDIRFWGKIFGIEKNYYIIEVRADDDLNVKFRVDNEILNETYRTISSPLVDRTSMPEIKSHKIVIPCEMNTGCNKYQYFATNSLSDGWTLLPPVTPHQIQLAKKVTRFFTGNLNAPVVSNPKFDGLECNYLRAQIARISATTHVSPKGYYETIFEGVEENEDTSTKRVYAFKAKELLEIDNWVHHASYIFEQGRTVWWHDADDDDDDEVDNKTFDDERSAHSEITAKKPIAPELGPALYTSLINDALIDGQIHPWTSFLSSKLVKNFGICILKSNLWPGAYSYGTKKGFDNIYIGWAQKYSVNTFNPYLQPKPQQEYNEEYDDLVEQIENELPRVVSHMKLNNKSDIDVNSSQNDNSEETEEKAMKMA